MQTHQKVKAVNVSGGKERKRNKYLKNKQITKTKTKKDSFMHYRSQYHISLYRKKLLQALSTYNSKERIFVW